MLAIALILLAVELLFIAAARRFMPVQQPTERSSHAHPTITGGGIVFVAGVVAWSAFSSWAYPWFVAGIVLVSVVSLIDDFHPLGIMPRLAVQILALAATLWQAGIGSLPVTAICLIAVVAMGYINAYNFMDGINAMTAFCSLVLLATLWFLNSAYCFIDPAYLYVAMIAAGIFAVFNARAVAICFAGDVGAISMAFITMLPMLLLMQSTGCWAWVVLAAVYGVDAALTIIHRIVLHKPIYMAHRMHAYQIMSNELHMPHQFVAALYASLQLIINLGAIMLPINAYLYLAIVLVLLSAAYFLFMRRCFSLHSGE
jgi:UDP-N-acetylmuramyl pentapeptide phosphotransferase/UDP-N-acetylglucosamine-1-phosphate transferase